jgi:hypothetical protein
LDRCDRRHFSFEHAVFAENMHKSPFLRRKGKSLGDFLQWAMRTEQVHLFCNGAPNHLA